MKKTIMGGPSALRRQDVRPQGVLNTAQGVRAVPQDYLNVARVLNLSPIATLFKVLIPATLPYMFTGFRLSLGIAWLVIVAAELQDELSRISRESGRTIVLVTNDVDEALLLADRIVPLGAGPKASFGPDVIVHAQRPRFRKTIHTDPVFKEARARARISAP
jgi:hypothetical protein